MSKPDDIPQDVWDEALRLWQDEEFDAGEVIIARAIIAAKAEEREECLAAVLDEQLSGDSDDEGDRAYMRAINDAAAAIRNRGEG